MFEGDNSAQTFGKIFAAWNCGVALLVMIVIVVALILHFAGVIDLTG